MRIAVALCILFFASSALAADRSLDALRTGADIAEYRRITNDGLSQAERGAALQDFVRTYPESPLAELALAECVRRGSDPRDLLAGVNPNERSRLLSRYKAHQAQAQASAEGPATAESEDATPRTRSQTRRNIRKSSR